MHGFRYHRGLRGTVSEEIKAAARERSIKKKRIWFNVYKGNVKFLELFHKTVVTKEAVSKAIMKRRRHRDKNREKREGKAVEGPTREQGKQGQQVHQVQGQQVQQVQGEQAQGQQVHQVQGQQVQQVPGEQLQGQQVQQVQGEQVQGQQRPGILQLSIRGVEEEIARVHPKLNSLNQRAQRAGSFFERVRLSRLHTLPLSLHENSTCDAH